MKHRILLVTLFILSSCAHSDSATTPSTVSGLITVAGRVIDFATGSGIAEVGIEFGEQRLVADAQGRFKVIVPIGNHTMRIDGEAIEAVVLVRGPWARGDFLARGGGCGSRYGAVIDRSTGKPVAGAAVSMYGSTTTAADGWYRNDGGCGSCGICNTVLLEVSAPGYRRFSQIVGRGVRNIRRLDIELDPTS